MFGSIFGRSRVALGSYFPYRNQPELTPEEASLVSRFHDLYYRRWSSGAADTINLSWFGYHVWKCPLDLWIYQELLVRLRPDFVIETGTHLGGSALFMAMVMDQLGHGKIISIDVEERQGLPQHPRIQYIVGSSIDEKIVGDVRKKVGARTTMVILDSDHSEAHVYREILAYKELVPSGGYLIVEDSNVNGHPTFPEHGPGPMEAINRFLGETTDFVIDDRCERFMMTLNPRGFLRRVR